MRRLILPAALIALILAACDRDTVEKKVEEKAAHVIEEATGKKATVDLTETGGSVTVGDDQIDVTLGADNLRRKIPDGVPLPSDETEPTIVPGIERDIVRWQVKGRLAETFADYDRRARGKGYAHQGTPLIDEGMATARWGAEGKPALSLYGYEGEQGEVVLTLVVERERPTAVGPH